MEANVAVDELYGAMVPAFADQSSISESNASWMVANVLEGVVWDQSAQYRKHKFEGEHSEFVMAWGGRSADVPVSRPTAAR